MIGLISIKDIFEVMIQKELGDDDIHQTLTVFINFVDKINEKIKGKLYVGK